MRFVFSRITICNLVPIHSVKMFTYDPDVYIRLQPIPSGIYQSNQLIFGFNKYYYMYQRLDMNMLNELQEFERISDYYELQHERTSNIIFYEAIKFSEDFAYIIVLYIDKTLHEKEAYVELHTAHNQHIKFNITRDISLSNIDETIQTLKHLEIEQDINNLLIWCH